MAQIVQVRGLQRTIIIRMNFLDKLYYLFYCMNEGLAEDIAQVKKEEFVRPYVKTKATVAPSLGLYMFSFLKYTGIIYLVKDTNERMDYILILYGVTCLILYLYFSSKEDEIVEYYRLRRANSKFNDGRAALFIMIGSFVLLMGYDLVKIVVPLPLLQGFLKLY